MNSGLIIQRSHNMDGRDSVGEPVAAGESEHAGDYGGGILLGGEVLSDADHAPDRLVTDHCLFEDCQLLEGLDHRFEVLGVGGEEGSQLIGDGEEDFVVLSVHQLVQVRQQLVLDAGISDDGGHQRDSVDGIDPDGHLVALHFFFEEVHWAFL